jgi:hypothetical protein
MYPDSSGRTQELSKAARKPLALFLIVWVDRLAPAGIRNLLATSMSVKERRHEKMHCPLTRIKRGTLGITRGTSRLDWGGVVVGNWFGAQH